MRASSSRTTANAMKNSVDILNRHLENSRRYAPGASVVCGAPVGAGVAMRRRHLSLLPTLALLSSARALRVITIGDGLANAAVHLSELGLRPARYTHKGLWAPLEVVHELAQAFPAEQLPTLMHAWDIVALSGQSADDGTARQYADAAAASATASLCIAGIGDDHVAWLQLARSGAALVTMSEAELSVVEDWLRDEMQASAPPPYAPVCAAQWPAFAAASEPAAASR